MAKTKDYTLKYGNFWMKEKAGQRKYNAGETVKLTEAQAERYKDKLVREPVAVAKPEPEEEVEKESEKDSDDSDKDSSEGAGKATEKVKA